jgi:hypothetical protein
MSEIEVELENALVDLARATDSRGRHIILGPRISLIDIALLKSKMPTALEYGIYLKSLMEPINSKTFWTDQNGEETLAHNIGLLAKAWELRARYERLMTKGES